MVTDSITKETTPRITAGSGGRTPAAGQAGGLLPQARQGIPTAGQAGGLRPQARQEDSYRSPTGGSRTLTAGEAALQDVSAPLILLGGEA